MKTIRHLRLGHRVVGGLALLLLLLALGNILSARQTLQLDARMTELVAVARPSVQLVHELTGLVDEVQGMAALHLVLGAGPELAALDARLLASRRTLTQRLAAWPLQQADDAERGHCEAVKASLADFWVEQDKLLALSRLAQRDPAALALARAQLSGPSQQAFQRLGAALEAWWAFNDQRVGQAVQQAHADVGRAMAMLLMLAAAVLVLAGVCAVLIRRSIIRPLAQDGAGELTPAALRDGLARVTVSALPGYSRQLAAVVGSVEGLALKSQLLALTAAVEAGRSAPSGSGIAEVADDARSLAQYAGAAARDLQALVGSAGDGLDADPPAERGAQAIADALPAQRCQSGACGCEPECESECEPEAELHGELRSADR